VFHLLVLMPVMVVPVAAPVPVVAPELPGNPGPNALADHSYGKHHHDSPGTYHSPASIISL